MEHRYVPPRPAPTRPRSDEVIKAWSNLPGIFGGCVLFAVGLAAWALGTMLGVPSPVSRLTVTVLLALAVRRRTRLHVIVGDEHTITLMSRKRTSVFEPPSGRTIVHPRSVRLVRRGIANDRWAVGQHTVSVARRQRGAMQRLVERVTRVSV